MLRFLLLYQAEGSQIVVTGRARLLGIDGAHRVELAGLARSESLKLLAQPAGGACVETEQAAAETIAEFCDDLPLALNIVGATGCRRPPHASPGGHPSVR